MATGKDLQEAGQKQSRDLRNALSPYLCCVLVFVCIVMLGSWIPVTPWFIEFLVRPPVLLLLAAGDSAPVLKLFELFPHFASQGLPVLYGAVVFSPLIGFGFFRRKSWLALQALAGLLHTIAFLLSL